MQFSKAAIAALEVPEGRSESFEWDDDLPGFGVRLRAGGSRTWVCQYRVGGRQRRESLGDTRKVGLEAARKAARQRFANVELGVDPRAGQQSAALTLRKAAAAYLDVKRDRLRPATFRQLTYHMQTIWKPLHDRDINEIKRADVAGRLQEIMRVNGRTQAARARANLSAFYGWACGEGMTETNPVAHTNDPNAGAVSRDRVLTDDEIREILNNCPPDDFGAIVKLLLLTGARREEIGGLRWDEIDLDSGVMTIGRERTKSRHVLSLTLPTLALDILRAQPRRNSDHVFGGRRGGKNGFNAWSWGKSDLDRRIAAPLKAWRLHDLRRTMRSGLGQIGISPDIAERTIGHVTGTAVSRVYDRHTYGPQIRSALAAWAAHVETIVSGKKSAKVRPLRA